MTTSLVITVIGSDRPGLVSALSDKAAEFGAARCRARAANIAPWIHVEARQINAIR